VDTDHFGARACQSSCLDGTPANIGLQALNSR
jgi:hypothetical protein